MKSLKIKTVFNSIPIIFKSELTKTDKGIFLTYRSVDYAMLLSTIDTRKNFILYVDKTIYHFLIDNNYSCQMKVLDKLGKNIKIEFNPCKLDTFDENIAATLRGLHKKEDWELLEMMPEGLNEVNWVDAIYKIDKNGFATPYKVYIQYTGKNEKTVKIPKRGIRGIVDVIKKGEHLFVKTMLKNVPTGKEYLYTLKDNAITYKCADFDHNIIYVEGKNGKFYKLRNNSLYYFVYVKIK